MDRRFIRDRTVPSSWDHMMQRLSESRREAMTFLLTHLPQCDLDCYPPNLFLSFADHALALRETAPWCKALNWEIFAHYVLFPRVNDEDLSFHRDIFHNSLWSRVKDLSTTQDRVLEVNRWCHEHASYQAQDDRTASPLTVYRCGSGRCGEESVFLVSALRSVGIPARQVYAPRWSHCDDNHAWVEALCDGQWRFLGACEPEPVLDRGWFTTAASRAVLVHSRVFGEGNSPLHGEPLGPDGDVTWFNQTPRYAETSTYTFRAFAEGKPAAGTKFYLQVLNEASFHTVAVLTADERGTARAQLGRGDLRVFATLDGLTAERDCTQTELDLFLTPFGVRDCVWDDFDFHAPADLRPAPAVLGEALKAERAETRRRGAALRQKRLDGFFRPGLEQWTDLLRAARGNCGVVLSFLGDPGSARRERLIRTLTAKDLRDVTRDVLEAHFAPLPPRADDVPEEVYWKYTACPRISLEKLSAWRAPLSRWLEGWKGTPSELWRQIDGRLCTRRTAYSILRWSPEQALISGGCDEKSKRLLLVAALRTLGVPARLRPLDGAPEYWAEGAFHSVLPEETGTLHLACPGGQTLRYRQDWTISRCGPEGWRLLTPEETWQSGKLSLTLPAGYYRVITTVRLPSGDQLASQCELDLHAGENRDVTLLLRPWALADMLTDQELPVLDAQTLQGQTLPDLFRTGDGPTLALWLEEGGEPTEHVLNELLEHPGELGRLPIRVCFLVRGRASLSQPTLAKALNRFPQIQVLLDDWVYDLEAVARHLGRDPDSPPLMVVCDRAGRAVYSDCGYRVGAVELLLKVADYLTRG